MLSYFQSTDQSGGPADIAIPTIVLQAMAKNFDCYYLHNTLCLYPFVL